MMISAVRKKYVVMAAALAVTAAFLTTASFTQGAPGPQANNQSVQKLLEERLSVLEQLVKVEVEAYRRDEVQFDSVADANRHLIEAQLELATGREERIRLWESFLKLMAETHKMAEASHRAGRGSLGDVLKSKAMRLKAEAELMRERGQ